MKIFSINKFLIKLLIIVIGYVNVYADLNGPFLIWGNKNFNDTKEKPILLPIHEIDENQLITSYSNAEIILLFQKSNLHKLNTKNFPCTKNLIMKNNNWIYIPHNYLPIEPFDYNDNIEIINLDSNDIQDNDKQLCEIIKERSKRFGDDNILGIISNDLASNDMYENERSKYKRNTINNKRKVNHPILYKDYNENVLLYTSSAPVLTIIYFDINDESTETTITLNNPKHVDIEGIIESDNDDNLFNFTIFYEENINENITLRFPFRTSLGYWSISSIEVETDTFSGVLSLMGDDKLIEAPHGFSYSCGRELIFMDENDNTLTMKNIQIEPIFWKYEHRNETRFSESYDCVGFMTAPILAGIFVSFLILFVTLIGIVFIMEIKPPLRFDNVKTKQLTIILNEKDVRN